MTSLSPLRSRPVWWLVTCLAVAGCVGPPAARENISYYTFAYTPPQATESGKISIVLQIDPFTAAPPYNSEKIIYEPEPYKRDVYHYHRWQSSPADLVTHYLSRDFKASGRFAAVLGTTGRVSATHFLTGTLDDILERDSRHGWQAVIGITVTLAKAGDPSIDRRILFQKSYRRSEPTSSRNPAAVVAAMSNAMAAVSEAVIADVWAALSTAEGTSGS